MLAGQPMLAPMVGDAIRKIPPGFGVSAAEVAVVPLVSVLPVDWDVEVPAVVVVDPGVCLVPEDIPAG
jgi:hypothetical protein